MSALSFQFKEPTVQNLANVLIQEMDHYEKYLEYLKGDEDRMVQLKMEELEESNKAKATLLLKIQAMEQTRQKIVTQIAEEKQIEKEQVKLKDICGALEESEGDALLKLREKLLTIVHQIRKVQDEASHLVASSLTWVDGSMATLKQILMPSGVYNASGRVNDRNAFAGRVVENKA